MEYCNRVVATIERVKQLYAGCYHYRHSEIQISFCGFVPAAHLSQFQNYRQVLSIEFDQLSSTSANAYP